ncbi:DUF6398 domain-containing protein [Leptothermofonsia sp. ETS-13]|uniref:DUF6398 domain-containing protein n=1 Tax=Leptothermofonsia sp. ETS-13 TaxID=3035696 RepID=UPI003BA157EC
MKATQLYQAFGVRQSKGQGKSKQIRELMDMHQLDPNWCLPNMVDRNPLAWMISVNSFIMDAHHALQAIQEEAFRKGLISYTNLIVIAVVIVVRTGCRGFTPGWGRSPHSLSNSNVLSNLATAINWYSLLEEEQK